MEALSQVSYGPTVRYLLYINSLVRQQEICIFAKRKGDNHLSNILARLRRFERPTSSLGGKRSIQLSYKRVISITYRSRLGSWTAISRSHGKHLQY